MGNDSAFDAAAEASGPLYQWWFNAIPGVFAALAPGLKPPEADAAPNGGAAPFPVDQIAQALSLTQQLVKPLYETLFQALMLNQPGQAFDVLEQLVQSRLGEWTDRLSAMNQALSLQPALVGALGSGWASAPFAALAEATKPLSLNLERAYGGLADAFGLAGSRALQQALRDMAAAALAHRQAQAEYLGLVAGALAKGADALMTRLAEMGRRGESVDSVKALLRLWARTTDEAMHAAMQTPGALEASARLVRTATRSRQQQQRVVAIASEALNVPTRAEVDEAYREIQQLKREVRQLRKAIAPDRDAADAAAAVDAAAGRKQQAHAKTPAKVSAKTAPRSAPAKPRRAPKAGRKAASA